MTGGGKCNKCKFGKRVLLGLREIEKRIHSRSLKSAKKYMIKNEAKIKYSGSKMH